MLLSLRVNSRGGSANCRSWIVIRLTIHVVYVQEDGTASDHLKLNIGGQKRDVFVNLKKMEQTFDAKTYKIRRVVPVAEGRLVAKKVQLLSLSLSRYQIFHEFGTLHNLASLSNCLLSNIQRNTIKFCNSSSPTVCQLVMLSRQVVETQFTLEPQ